MVKLGDTFKKGASEVPGIDGVVLAIIVGTTEGLLVDKMEGNAVCAMILEIEADGELVDTELLADNDVVVDDESTELVDEVIG
ncbi:hypothetical protein G6F56_003474 [Rhizopus delemar]|nr:hypothetical protein G6F56_003474 [Rhizopus delemar]